MSACLDPCWVCSGPAWYCDCFQAVPQTFLFPGPAPVAIQQPEFGWAPVATYDWSPAAASSSTSDWTGIAAAAAAETSASPLVHHQHAQEMRRSTLARTGASGAVTAAGAVTKTATQKERKFVLDRGQAAEGSRVRKNQWTKGPLKHHMPRGRVLLALLHGASAHAPTVPNDALVEMILATLKQSLNITDIDKYVVRNTMGAAEAAALKADLQYTQDHFRGKVFGKTPGNRKKDYLRRWFRAKHQQGMRLTRAEQAEVGSHLKACGLPNVSRYSPGNSSSP